MSILTIVSFFTGLFNIGANWFEEVLYTGILFIDGIAYTLLAYAFKLFQLMCQLNFNSLYGLISGVLTRLEALIMVFVVYKLGISLITFMLNPEEASKKGKEILINIFITAALLLSYNTIFTVFNELSMIIVGTPDNYNFVVLGQIAELTGGKDSGAINRIVFGTDEQIPDIGEYIAFSVCANFVTDAKDPLNTSNLYSDLKKNGEHVDFMRLKDISRQIGKKYNFFPVVGFAGAVFMIYSIVKTTIQVGIRAFKLMILQIIAPIAIITVIADGIKGDKFKKFYSQYLSIYTEVFIRMFSLLLISNFVVKFIRNIADYFPTINSDEWYTTTLMILLILVAAFKFATDIPQFIDGILGTHLGGDKKFGNFIGGLLGAGVGAVGGFFGGLAGGKAGGAFAGLFSGAVKGAQSGSKGNSVAEFFKGQRQVATDARTRGENIAARGGLFQTAIGGLQKPLRHHDDRDVARLDRQSQALDEVEAAEKYAVKDAKAGNATGDFDTAWQNENGAFGDLYSSGYGDVKLGEDKDAYASKMLNYDRDYQSAQAEYDNLSSMDLSSYQRDVADSSRRLGEAQAMLESTRADGTATAEDIAAAEALYTEAQTNYANAQSAYRDAAKPIEDARRRVDEAKDAAEKRAKDYYDKRKEHESSLSAEVRAKRERYRKLGGQDVTGEGRSAEKKRIHTEKANIQNKPSYVRTHGGNPKK